MMTLNFKMPGIRAALLFFLLATLTGCVRGEYRLSSDEQKLKARNRFVVEATCTEATRREYTAFRDEFGMLASLPRTRLTATFKVDRIIQGHVGRDDVQPSSFQLIDARNINYPYSWFIFHPGQHYTIGFNSFQQGYIRKLTVIGTEPPSLPMLFSSLPEQILHLEH